MKAKKANISYYLFFTIVAFLSFSFGGRSEPCTGKYEDDPASSRCGTNYANLMCIDGVPAPRPNSHVDPWCTSYTIYQCDELCSAVGENSAFLPDCKGTFNGTEAVTLYRGVPNCSAPNGCGAGVADPDPWEHPYVKADMDCGT